MPSLPDCQCTDTKHPHHLGRDCDRPADGAGVSTLCKVCEDAIAKKGDWQIPNPSQPNR